MAIRSEYVNGIDFSNGEALIGIDLKDTFDEFYTRINTIKTNLTVPIGTLMAWNKNFPGVPQTLPSGWVECDGTEKTISLSSPYADGLGHFTPPNLNQSIFLRGASTSGNLSTAGSHNHVTSGGLMREGFGGYAYASAQNQTTGTTEVQPPYYSIVWIMRVV